MRGSHAPAGIPVEIFVEEDVVAEMQILRQLIVVTEHWAFAILVFEEKPPQPPGNLLC